MPKILSFRHKKTYSIRKKGYNKRWLEKKQLLNPKPGIIKEPATKTRIGKSKPVLNTIERQEPSQLKQSKPPRPTIKASQKKYLDVITGLEFNFKEILPGSGGWNTLVYENKKYNRRLILYIRDMRVKRGI
jgi:hypothetical protein